MTDCDDADCGNQLFDYMFGSPEYRKWRKRKEQREAILSIVGGIILAGVIIYFFYYHI